MLYKMYCLRYNSTESNWKSFSQVFPTVMFQEFTVFIFIIYLSPKGPMDHLVHYIFSSKLKSASTLLQCSKFSHSIKMLLNSLIPVTLRVGNWLSRKRRAGLTYQISLTCQKEKKNPKIMMKDFHCFEGFTNKKNLVWQATQYTFSGM